MGKHVSKLRIAGLVVAFAAVGGCDPAQREFERSRREDTLGAYGAFLAAYPSHRLATEAKKRLNDVLVRRTYHWNSSEGHGAGPASDVSVGERADHTLQATPLKSSSVIPRKDGKPVVDQPGSRGIEIFVNRKLGYSTYAGLRFREKVVVDLLPDGAVEVDRESVAAEADAGSLVSRRVSIGGKDHVVMVKGDATSPAAPSASVRLEPSALPLSTDEAVRAAMLEDLNALPGPPDMERAPTIGRFPEMKVKVKDRVVSFRLVSGLLVSLEKARARLWIQAPNASPPFQYLEFRITDATRYCDGDVPVYAADLRLGSLVTAWVADGTMAPGEGTMETKSGTAKVNVNQGYLWFWIEDAAFPDAKEDRFALQSLRRGLVRFDLLRKVVSGVNCDGLEVPL